MTDTNEDKHRLKITQAVERRVDDNGNVPIKVTLRGDGIIHTGEGAGVTAEQGDELTVPFDTALAHALAGYAEPVAPKKTAG